MNTIYRFLAGCVIAGVYVPAAMSIPATPFPVKVAQPEGSLLTLVMEGDEHGMLMLTTDGIPVMQNPVSGIYEYASLGDGKLHLSGVAAKDPACRPSEAEAAKFRISSGQEELTSILRQTRESSRLRRSPQKRIKRSDFPTIGHIKSLVILVEFADVAFSTLEDPHDYYSRLLNEEGFTWSNGADGSARDFYRESSSGQFDPEFVVVGPVRLEKPVSAYGTDGEYYDMGCGDMVVETAMAADGMVDFSEFDADGDGYVDNIHIFYAGYGQADSGISKTIWPQSGYIEGAWGKELILDGVHIDRYACSNEIRGGSTPPAPVGIGVFVHEFGHVLGLADHYDTLYSSGRTGVNNWDTMARASYYNNMNTPPLFSAFERAELGWLEYDVLTGREAEWLPLYPLADTNSAYRIDVPGTDGREYFVVENRRRTGWDAWLPGEGMLVWHVDMDEQRWHDNTINIDPSHQYLDLIEADGREDDRTVEGDPFPGKDNVRSFSFRAWDGSETFALDWLKDDTEVMELLWSGTDFTLPSPEVTLTRRGGGCLSFTWAEVEDAQSYSVAVSDEAGMPVEGFELVESDAPTETTVTGLTPRSAYSIDVRSRLGSYVSAPAPLQTTTSDWQFFELTPELAETPALRSDGFRLAWHPLPEAVDYLVTVEERAYGETVRAECHFPKFPDGWSSSSEKFNKELFGFDSPSLQLSEPNEWLEYEIPGGRIRSLAFWAGTTAPHTRVRVDSYSEETGEWKPLRTFTPGSFPGNYMVDAEGETRLRIVHDGGPGCVLLDDVTCAYDPFEWNIPGEYEEVSTAGVPSFTAASLKPETLYRVSVTGLSGSERSLTAVWELTTSGGAGIGMTETSSECEVNEYDIFGRPVSPSHTGIVITHDEKGRSIKRLRKVH